MLDLIAFGHSLSFSLFFFTNPPTTEIYTLSLHDALPIWPVSSWKALNLRKTLLMASSVRLKPLNCVFRKRSEERFSRNAETDLVCRLLLEKKKKYVRPTTDDYKTNT